MAKVLASSNLTAIVCGRRRDPSGGTFYDLGSGVGHVALLGAVLEQLTVFRGVELVRCCRLNAPLQHPYQASERVQVARTALRTFDGLYPNLRLADRVFFDQDDMRNVSLEPANAVWISSLALPPSVLDDLARKLTRELRPGAVDCRVKHTLSCALMKPNKKTTLDL